MTLTSTPTPAPAGRSLNVAYLYGAYEDMCYVYLVLEKCSGGELGARVKEAGGRLSEEEAAFVMRGVLQALAQCHAKDILMRDVKPGNFLFLDDADSFNSPLKAIDFGISTYCRPGDVKKQRAGSPSYLAPEVCKEAYGLPADIWSAGIMAYNLITGRAPWTGDYADELREAVESNGGKLKSTKELFRAILLAELDFTTPPWDTVSPECRDFVSSMLERDPAKRITAVEALAHPWLSRHGSATQQRPATSSLDGSLPQVRPARKSLVQRLQRYATFPLLKQEAMLRFVQLHGHEPEFQNACLAEMRELFRNAARQTDDSGAVYPARWSPAAVGAAVAQVGTEVEAPVPVALSSGYASVRGRSPAAGESEGGDASEEPDWLFSPGVAHDGAAWDDGEGAEGDASGFLTYAQFATLLKGFNISRAEIGQLMMGTDVERDGLVSEDEWLASVTDWPRLQRSPQWEQWVQEVFVQFNVSRTGLLSSEDVNALLCGGACVVPDDAEAAIREVLEGRDGAIGLSEFVELMGTEIEDLSIFDPRLFDETEDEFPSLP